VEVTAAGTLEDLFDAAFVLLARMPQAAEEPQLLGRADEECGSVVENMCRSPLILAARCGLVGVAWLVARHCNPRGLALNQLDAMGCSALRYAIVNKDETMCRCLLSFPELNLEQRESRGDTALMQAVGANAPTVCRMLLERSADASYVNRGQTALDLAEALGYEACSAVLKLVSAPSADRLDAPLANVGAGSENEASSESELDEEVRESQRSPMHAHTVSGDSSRGSSMLWANLLRNCGDDDKEGSPGDLDLDAPEDEDEAH
ncbi:unnamed protein product, partial [Polarella glacialis]